MYALSENLQNENFVMGIFDVCNFLNDHDINILKEVAKKNNLSKAKITGDSNIIIKYDDNKSVRNNYITWIKYDKSNNELTTLYKKIVRKIIEVNNNIFKFNLTDFEPFQYTSYGIGEYYSLHIDMFNDLGIANTQRKLSFTIQLTDPTKYQGGDLVVYNGEKSLIADKGKGTITFFPSFLPHEVKEVTDGKRLSLVGWAWGPKFV